MTNQPPETHRCRRTGRPHRHPRPHPGHPPVAHRTHQLLDERLRQTPADDRPQPRHRRLLPLPRRRLRHHPPAHPARPRAPGSLHWHWPPHSRWQHSQPHGWASSPHSPTSAWTPTSPQWFQGTAWRGCTRPSESPSSGPPPSASSPWPSESTQHRAQLSSQQQEHGCYWWAYSPLSKSGPGKVSKTPLPDGHPPAFRLLPKLTELASSCMPASGSAGPSRSRPRRNP